jgi:cell division protein FtsI/penicillin-binding protein 2
MRNGGGNKRLTSAYQSLTFSRRMLLTGGAQVAVGAALIGRLGWLSVAENEHYQLLSESNRVQLIIVPPRRGWVIDRRGKPIAINRSDFRVDIIPEQLENTEQTLTTLTKLLDLSVDDVDRIQGSEGRARLPAGPGRRECAVRELCGGDRATARAAGRAADARLLPLLPRWTRSRSSRRLRRYRLGQGL